MEKGREFQKNIHFCFIDYAKAFDCVDHNKLWKQIDGLIQWFAEFRPQTSSKSSPGDLVTDTDPRAPAQTFQPSNSEELRADTRVWWALHVGEMHSQVWAPLVHLNSDLEMWMSIQN